MLVLRNRQDPGKFMEMLHTYMVPKDKPTYIDMQKAHGFPFQKRSGFLTSMLVYRIVFTCIYIYIWGFPKWGCPIYHRSISIGFYILNHSFWGTPSGSHIHICTYIIYIYLHTYTLMSCVCIYI
jgi:hypothetical protein